MRRLPVYFLIDVSESMVGEPIEMVQEGISQIITELRKDPYALETVYVSIIIFAGKPRTLVPLVELYNFYPPKFPIGSGTSIGSAIEYLSNDLDKNIIKNSPDQKGDWKPIIFLFTDGNPTDKYLSSFSHWEKKNKKSTSIVAVSLGENTDTSIFRPLTDTVLLLKDINSESFSKFFKWVTASIKVNSESIAKTNSDGLQLAPLTNGFLSKIDLEKVFNNKIDENFAVILAKCQSTKRNYLIKYQKRISKTDFDNFSLDTRDFKLVGAYPIDNNYYELSDGTPNNLSIRTSELNGFPTCPCCGNQYGFSHCTCGQIMCTGEEEVNRCPWCSTEAYFSFDSKDININRTRG